MAASTLPFLTFLLCCSVATTRMVDCRKTYIVHMDATQKPSSHATHHEWYVSHLESLSIPADRHLLYTYTDALHGFAAALDPDHLPLLRSHPSVLHLQPDPLLRLHTTRTPEFLGLYHPPRSTDALLHAAEASTHRVVVGVLDTGVWPEVPSFDDDGLPEPPATWRGGCEPGADFPPSLCNNKLVGARSFSRGFRAAAGSSKPSERVSSRDRDGHGTHTASTAAGSPVANASLLGYAIGTARGMAPGARVAIYKVCWSSGCYGSDILAGIDCAISDGVDVLSLSLGGGSSAYHRDTIAVGTFAAQRRGVFVACSAGNSGPRPGSLANTAPWLATVGAGTLDRDFPAFVSLGNGDRHAGVSLYSGRGMGRRMVPLVYVHGGGNSSNLCLPGTLEKGWVRGKVVVCDRGINERVEKGEVVRAAGGVGMVLANTAADGEELVANSHVLPALAVGSRAGDAIRRYAASGRGGPRATIRVRGTVLGVQPSPVVAAFSSRAPNGVVPQVLKPDVIGPGVNILAGWSGSVGPTGLDSDQRRSHFNIMSGTSMSCPHISGVAALLKAAHPDWSPAAIKSALMTTACTVDNTGSPLRDAADGSIANPYAFGAGHVHPQKALSPGLVYDINTEDYVSFLCSLKYTRAQIRTITARVNVSCAGRFRNPGNLNYPSFSVVFRGAGRRVRYVRELTNVGVAGSVYRVKVEGPAGVDVRVKPARLVFRGVRQKLRYAVTFVPKKGCGSPGDVEFGWVTWSNRGHQVRSPVAYRWTA